MRFRRERHRHGWVSVAAQVEHMYQVWGGVRPEHPTSITTNVLQRCACGELRRQVVPGSWTWEQIEAR